MTKPNPNPSSTNAPQSSYAQGDERAVDNSGSAAFDANAQDIAHMRGRSESTDSYRGHTDIAPRGIERVVEQAVRRIPGVVDLDARLAGLGGRGYPRINVQLDGERQLAAATADIAVNWPSPVTEIAKETRYAVAEAIRIYTGYTVSRVNVTVGETVPGRRVTRDDVRRRPLIEAVLPQVAAASEVRSPVVSTKLKELRPIEVGEIVELRGIDRGKEPEVRSVETPEQGPLRAVGEPREHEARSVATPEQKPLRAVGKPTEHEARVVDAPQERPLRKVGSPQDHKPRRVHAPRDRRVRQVEAPKPKPLRPAGEVVALNRLTKPKVPKPVRLKTPKAPAEKRLRKISTRPKFKQRSVSVPPKEPLRHISITPLNAHPLHVEAPRPTMLREIHANELEVWHPTVQPLKSSAKNKIHLTSEGGRRG